MPKIINEVYEKVLTCAKRKMFDEGYSSLSLRSVAKECGIAVGTIYNYFENKDTLIATILLEDWKIALVKMEMGCKESNSIHDGLSCIYQAIKDFCMTYEDVWNQFNGPSTSVKSRHTLLRNQIVERVNVLLTTFGHEEDKDMSVIVAECILASATQKEISMEQFHKMMKRLFHY